MSLFSHFELVDDSLLIADTKPECEQNVKDIRLLSQSSGKWLKLFISYVKPYKSVTSDTIGRWIRSVMLSSAIDCENYKAHSVRSASTSRATNCQIPIHEIMKTAGWSSARTFSQFYDKKIDNIEYNDTDLNVQNA